MSEDFCSKPACDGKKFFIEVTGIKHGKEQDFEFYDLTDMSQQSALESKKAIDPQLKDTTIYSWDWCAETENRNVWLKVEAENGPIKLPLFQNVTALARKLDEQDYLVHSVLPLTLLPTYQDALADKDRLAPARVGFIYIFYNHKAWREIQISPEEGGTHSLKDVDLYQYRTGRDKPFKQEKRIATGVQLKEIWLPAKEKNQSSSVHIAFSEVQWSAQYLNYLEANTDELVQRATALQKLSAGVLKTTTLPQMRIRAPETELFLAEPSNLNKDLSGDWLKNTYQTIKDELSAVNAQGDNAVNILKYEQPYQLEYAMKQSALTEIINSDTSEAELWCIGKSNDYLEEAKTRHIRAIVLDDPLFDLRHHAYLTQSAVGYLQQVYVDMSQQKYYRSAELVQKLVVPKTFGQQDNPFYQHRKEMDTFLGGRFHRTLRTIERQVCCRDVKKLQGYVQSLVNQQRVAQVLRDISALDDINASAAHVIVGYAMSALSLDIDQLDQMSNPSKKQPLPYLNTARQIISPEENHPLHKLLFPEEGAIDLDDAAYTAPEPFNSGSGFATAESLALWAKDNMLINDGQLQVMDLAFLLPANSNEDENGIFNNTRRIANITDSILKGYFDTLLKLSEDLASEAKVIQFNAAYAPVLGLMKATNSTMWGDITYVPVDGAEFKGTIVGVHGHGLSYGLSAADREYIKTKKKKAPMSRLYDHNGRLVAATGKRVFKPSDRISGIKGEIGPKLPLKVVAVSQESRIAESLNQANTQRALQDMNRSGLTASNAYEKLKVPYVIAVIELINLRNNHQHLKNVIMGEDETGYSLANSLSAILDVGVALTHASNLYSQNASRLATASQTTAVTMPEFLVNKLTFKEGSVQLVKQISRLGLVSIGAGFLTAAIAGWDSFRLAQNNDLDASLAMRMVATGTLVTTVATGFFKTSAPILFGMGPVAWLGIGLAVVGGALYLFWKDTPIEVWLKNGPFGQKPSSDYAHLQDPQTAFERFIGLILNLSVKAYRLGTQTDFAPEFIKKKQQQGATHVIHVNTNLASLFNVDDVKIQLYARQAIEQKTETIKRTGSSYDSKIINLEKNNLHIIEKVTSDEGCAYFVRYDLDVPAFDIKTSLLKSAVYKYYYQPVFVLRTQLQVEQAYFPTLALEDNADSQPSPLVPAFAPDDDDFGWAKNIVPA